MNGFGTLDRLVLLLLPLTFIATVAAVLILRPMSKALADRFRGNAERLEDLEAAVDSLTDSVGRLEDQLRRFDRDSQAVGQPEPKQTLLRSGMKSDPVS